MSRDIDHATKNKETKNMQARLCGLDHLVATADVVSPAGEPLPPPTPPTPSPSLRLSYACLKLVHT